MYQIGNTGNANYQEYTNNSVLIRIYMALASSQFYKFAQVPPFIKGGNTLIVFLCVLINHIDCHEQPKPTEIYYNGFIFNHYLFVSKKS